MSSYDKDIFVQYISTPSHHVQILHNITSSFSYWKNIPDEKFLTILDFIKLGFFTLFVAYNKKSFIIRTNEHQSALLYYEFEINNDLYLIENATDKLYLNKDQSNILLSSLEDVLEKPLVTLGIDYDMDS